MSKSTGSRYLQLIYCAGKNETFAQIAVKAGFKSSIRYRTLRGAWPDASALDTKRTKRRSIIMHTNKQYTLRATKGRTLIAWEGEGYYVVHHGSPGEPRLCKAKTLKEAETKRSFHFQETELMQQWEAVNKFSAIRESIHCLNCLDDGCSTCSA